MGIQNIKTGVARIYTDVDNPLTAEEIETLPKHRMDCMDCHNRPTHIFRSPSYSVNLALATGRIDTAVPYIKRQAVLALNQDYDAADKALKGIDEALTSSGPFLDYLEAQGKLLRVDKEVDVKHEIAAGIRKISV